MYSSEEITMCGLHVWVFRFATLPYNAEFLFQCIFFYSHLPSTLIFNPRYDLFNLVSSHLVPFVIKMEFDNTKVALFHEKEINSTKLHLLLLQISLSSHIRQS
mmetsp:Transcript_27151/g.56158  ORF Transcript_27151/g.56158 Transcript_27151/m.56158 type:complete len:103 (+) Transcript_27151:471-779(+)